MNEVSKLVDEEKFINGSLIDVKKFLRECEEELIRIKKFSVYLVDMNQKPDFHDFIKFLNKTGINNPTGRYILFDIDPSQRNNVGGMGDFLLRTDNVENFMDALATLGKMRYQNSIECFDIETNTNTELD